MSPRIAADQASEVPHAARALPRRALLTGGLALMMTASFPAAAVAGKRRPVRKRRRLTAAQRGSGRVQRIDASLPGPVASGLPAIESKGGFGNPATPGRRFSR